MRALVALLVAGAAGAAIRPPSPNVKQDMSMSAHSMMSAHEMTAHDDTMIGVSSMGDTMHSMDEEVATVHAMDMSMGMTHSTMGENTMMMMSEEEMTAPGHHVHSSMMMDSMMLPADDSQTQNECGVDGRVQLLAQEGTSNYMGAASAVLAGGSTSMSFVGCLEQYTGAATAVLYRLSNDEGDSVVIRASPHAMSMSYTNGSATSTLCGLGENVGGTFGMAVECMENANAMDSHSMMHGMTMGMTMTGDGDDDDAEDDDYRNGLLTCRVDLYVGGAMCDQVTVNNVRGPMNASSFSTHATAVDFGESALEGFGHLFNFDAYAGTLDADDMACLARTQCTPVGCDGGATPSPGPLLGIGDEDDDVFDMEGIPAPDVLNEGGVGGTVQGLDIPCASEVTMAARLDDIPPQGECVSMMSNGFAGDVCVEWQVCGVGDGHASLSLQLGEFDSQLRYAGSSNMFSANTNNTDLVVLPGASIAVRARQHTPVACECHPESITVRFNPSVCAHSTPGSTCNDHDAPSTGTYSVSINGGDLEAIQPNDIRLLPTSGVSQATFVLYEGDVLLQDFVMPTSCAQPVYMGALYGSVELIEFGACDLLTDTGSMTNGMMSMMDTGMVASHHGGDEQQDSPQVVVEFFVDGLPIGGSSIAAGSATRLATCPGVAKSSRTVSSFVLWKSWLSASQVEVVSSSLIQSPTNTPSNSPSGSNTASISLSASVSISQSATSSISMTSSTSPSGTPSTTPSSSVSRSTTPSSSVSPSGTSSPTASPSASRTPTRSPSNTPSSSPTNSPSKTPTSTPSVSPSVSTTATSSRSTSSSPTTSPSATTSTTSSASTTPTTTTSPSTTTTRTISPSTSTSASLSSTTSTTPSITISTSPSTSGSSTTSPSGSVSTSVSPSRSVTPSGTPSVTPSSTASTSIGASQSSSLSPSPSPTASTSTTVSPSTSISTTGSTTPSMSPSTTSTVSTTSSTSPSSTSSTTPSVTTTITPTRTPSRTPTRTPTRSSTTSPSTSTSISISTTPSTSMSSSTSPTTSASSSTSPSTSGSSTTTPSVTTSVEETPSMSTSVSPSRTPTRTPTGSPSATPTPTSSPSPGEPGCDGVPNSGLVNDLCGVCDGDDSTCQDCNGVPNGNSVVLDCGCDDADSCNDDCGVPNGGNACHDDCGVPNGGNACHDCNGVPNGNAAVLACGCNDADSCNDDCGVPNGGNACHDDCGVPNGGNACHGCDGVANSDLVFDDCDPPVCGGDGSSCAVELGPKIADIAFDIGGDQSASSSTTDGACVHITTIVPRFRMCPESFSRESNPSACDGAQWWRVPASDLFLRNADTKATVLSRAHDTGSKQRMPVKFSTMSQVFSTDPAITQTLSPDGTSCISMEHKVSGPGPVAPTQVDGNGVPAAGGCGLSNAASNTERHNYLDVIARDMQFTLEDAQHITAANVGGTLEGETMLTEDVAQVCEGDEMFQLGITSTGILSEADVSGTVCDRGFNDDPDSPNICPTRMRAIHHTVVMHLSASWDDSAFYAQNNNDDIQLCFNTLPYQGITGDVAGSSELAVDNYVPGAAIGQVTNVVCVDATELAADGSARWGDASVYDPPTTHKLSSEFQYRPGRDLVLAEAGTVATGVCQRCDANLVSDDDARAQELGLSSDQAMECQVNELECRLCNANNLVHPQNSLTFGFDWRSVSIPVLPFQICVFQPTAPGCNDIEGLPLSEDCPAFFTYPTQEDGFYEALPSASPSPSALPEYEIALEAQAVAGEPYQLAVNMWFQRSIGDDVYVPPQVHSDSGGPDGLLCYYPESDIKLYGMRRSTTWPEWLPDLGAVNPPQVRAAGVAPNFQSFDAPAFIIDCQAIFDGPHADVAYSSPILVQWKMKSCVTPPQAGPCFDDPDFGGERYCAAGATPEEIDAVDSLYRDESDDVFEGNGCAYGLSGVECDRFEYINCPAVGGKEDF